MDLDMLDRAIKEAISKRNVEVVTYCLSRLTQAKGGHGKINEFFHEDYQMKKETQGVIESDDDYKHDLPDAQELDSEQEAEL